MFDVCILGFLNPKPSTERPDRRSLVSSSCGREREGGNVGFRL